MTKAPITPGTQPQQVSNKTINTEPQPLSITAKGGKNNANITRKKDIYFVFGPFVTLTVRPFTSFTERPFVTLTEGPFALLTERSMSLSARRAVSQRSGLSTQWSLSVAVAQRRSRGLVNTYRTRIRVMVPSLLVKIHSLPDNGNGVFKMELPILMLVILECLFS